MDFWLPTVFTESDSTLARKAGQADSLVALSAAVRHLWSLFLGFFDKRDTGSCHHGRLRLRTNDRRTLLDLLEALRTQEVALWTAEEAVAVPTQLAATTVLKLLSHIN